MPVFSPIKKRLRKVARRGPRTRLNAVRELVSKAKEGLIPLSHADARMLRAILRSLKGAKIGEVYQDSFWKWLPVMWEEVHQLDPRRNQPWDVANRARQHQLAVERKAAKEAAKLAKEQEAKAITDREAAEAARIEVEWRAEEKRKRETIPGSGRIKSSRAPDPWNMRTPQSEVQQESTGDAEILRSLRFRPEVIQQSIAPPKAIYDHIQPRVYADRWDNPQCPPDEQMRLWDLEKAYKQSPTSTASDFIAKSLNGRERNKKNLERLVAVLERISICPELLKLARLYWASTVK